MAKASIGELNVKIAADAKGFHNVIAQSEKALSIFAAKAAAPFAIGFGAAGAITHPIETILGPIEKLMDIIPGLEKFTFFFDPAKYSAAMKEVQENTMELARAAERLDIDPQFLKALRLTAGPLADSLEPALLKLLRFQGELRMGGEDVLSAGGRKAMTIAEKWGFDPQEIANLTSEELLLKFADQLAAVESPAERTAMAMDILGKSGAKLAGVFAKGSEGIEKWRDTLKEMGIDPKEMIGMAKLVSYLEKLEKLEAEAVKNAEFMRSGGPRAVARLGMAQAGSMSEYLSQFGHYLDTFTFLKGALRGAFGVSLPDVGPNPRFEKMLELGQKMAEAPEVILPQETDADRATAAIEKLNDALDEQAELLRLTELGWGGVERQVLDLSRAVMAGGDVFAAMEVLDRLAGVAAGKEAERQAKDLERLTSQITGKVAGLGGSRAGAFAPVAVAGSNEAAAAFNREWTSGGGGDLILTVEQILDLMKKPALSPEMQERIRTAATELQKLNGKLNPVGEDE